jgi:hypothetical protein
MCRRKSVRDLWLGLGALLMIAGVGLQRGEAREPRPYCFQGDRATTGGTLDCSYYTLEQCLATASGNGGGCSRNPALGWRAIEQGRNRSRDPGLGYQQGR